ncbi:tetratricopeptide repeat protein [Nonomuraea sp. NPDC050556]|uniref:tetratricopeptide repeat protein n=1 Tax=Nonomuraea sp. NPDC050556 TaxID=3364369 RepID=UPI0037B45797
MLSNLGTIRHGQGRLKEALDAKERALAILRGIVTVDETERTLTGIGLVHLDAGRHSQARAAFTDALDLARQAGELRREVGPLLGLARLELALGRPRQSVEQLDAVLALATSTGERLEEAETLVTLAEAYGALGEHERALRVAQSAEGPATLEARARAAQAAACLGLGQAERGADLAVQASRTQRDTSQWLARSRTLLILACARHLAGDPHRARRHWTRARRLRTLLERAF